MTTLASRALESSWSELVERWANFLATVEGRASSTVRAYRATVERFLSDSAAGKAPQEITRELVEAHLRRLYLGGLGESGRRRALVALRDFGRYLVGHGLLEANPVAEIRAPRVYLRERPVLTVAETRKLLGFDRESLPRLPRSEFLVARDLALWAVAYSAALRASEIGSLRIDGLLFDEEQSIFSVLVGRAKAARRDERLWLPRRTSRLLGFYLGVRSEAAPGSPFLFPAERGGSRPLTSRQVHRLFRERLREAGIESKGRKLSPHALRHSRAQHLLDAGVDVRAVQTMLRHQRLETTASYLHTSEERIVRYLLKKEPLERDRERRFLGMKTDGPYGKLLQELSDGFVAPGPN